MAASQDDISQISGDPIQQLFTTLGKFHRHLNKAQHSPDGAGWCDACMNELMAGLEISIACDWTPVKDALIDAARILHSYEQAGKAGLCVPFLFQSYELLSLMVGDLIVDKVRDGVKQKWREHYMQAIDAVEAQGIALVEDEGHDSPAAAMPPPKEATSSDGSPRSPSPDPLPLTSVPSKAPAHADISKQAAAKPPAAPDNIDFDLPPLSEDFAIEADKNKTDSSEDTTPFPPPSRNEETPLDHGPFNDVLEMNDLLKLDGAEKETGQAETESKEEAQTKKTAPPEAEKKQAASKNATATPTTAELEIIAPPETTASAPVATSQPDEEAELKTPQEADTAASDSPAPKHDADAPTRKASDAEAAPASEPPASKSDAMTTDQADTSPEALMRRVQASISAGDTRNTKAMALELAVTMARIECEQARQELAAAETKLLDNGRVIEESESKIAQRESDLMRAEELLAASEGERNACRERIGVIDEEMTGLSGALADIDAQIAALQQQRTEQLNRIENKQAEHEEAIDNESRAQTELEALSQDVDALKDKLAAAREAVSAKNKERRALELDIVRAQEESETRRLSLSAMERMLRPEADAPVSNETSDTLL